ncbi:MAG TPA: hypothetical protein VJ724_11665 [Tahibacter sp.]|nr:hypothetical protein [Tahibacter sp.]
MKIRPILRCTALAPLLVAASASAEPSSRLEYAQQCAAQMGTIPEFNCMSGQILPIKKNGVAQTQPVDDCDDPVQLGLGGSGQCVPFSRFLTLSTGNANVTTAVVCRKYDASSGPNDAKFRDIAVIQHDRTTGATCFFQSKLSGPLHDGTSVPSPQSNSGAASNVWLEPESNGPGGIRCTRCHDADPFIWSPYVVQVADLSKWDPLGPWNSNFLDAFGMHVKTFKPNGNACTSCHRIGSEVCDDAGGGNVSVPEVAAKRWMPPGFSGTAAQWNASFGDAIDQLESCCANPNQAVCNTQDATGANVPPSPDADVTQLLESTLLPLREP